MIHRPKENKKKNTKKSVCNCAKSQPFHHLQHQRVLKNLFLRPEVATVLRFALCVFVDVQLQVGQAAAWGQRRKAVIRDIFSVGHRGVTNLSASIWFTGKRDCTVFRHVMQLL